MSTKPKLPPMPSMSHSQSQKPSSKPPAPTKPTTALHPTNSISLSICQNIFGKLQSDLAAYLFSKVPLLRAELEKRAMSSISSRGSNHETLVRDFFAYRTTETYSSTLRLIKELSGNIDGVALFYLFLVHYMPESGMMERIKQEMGDSQVFGLYQAAMEAQPEAATQRQTLAQQFSFGNWISTSEMRELVMWGDRLYHAITLENAASATQPAKKGKKKGAAPQNEPKQPSRSFTQEVLEMLVFTICADVLSIILRSFEVETVHAHGADATQGGMLRGASRGAQNSQQQRLHPNDIDLQMDESDNDSEDDHFYNPATHTDVASSLASPTHSQAPQSMSSHIPSSISRQAQSLLKTILDNSLHILRYIRFRETEASTVDTWNTFGKRPFYQWCYVIRRLSMFDFSLLITTICGYLSGMEAQGVSARMLLFLQVLKYVDVRIDTVRNNETFERYLDYLLSTLNQYASASSGAPVAARGKKGKKNAPQAPESPPSPQVMVKVHVLEALLSVYSQLDFEKQRISHLQVKTNNIFHSVIRLTSDADSTTRSMAFQLASTIIARSRYEFYNDTMEAFAEDLLRQMHGVIGRDADWVLYACLARILEDKRNVNINIRFVDLFSIDDDHLERDPDFVTLVYAESNKHVDETFNGVVSSDTHSQRDDETNISNAEITDTSKQAHERAKFEYQAVRNRLFKMLNDALFRSKHSLLLNGISVDETFDIQVFYLSWMVLRMAQISLEQVSQNLLPELLGMTVAQNNPQVIMLGLRVLRMFVCTSERAKVDDTATFTPHMLHDLRLLHRTPNYERFAEEIVRKNFIHVQKMIEFCDKELGVDVHNQLMAPIPVSSYLHPVKFEDLYTHSSIGAVLTGSEEPNSAGTAWKDAPQHEQEAVHSLSGYSFFSVAQMALNQVREQRASNRDDASTVFTAETDGVLSPLSVGTPSATPATPPMSPAAGARKPALRLLIERNAHLLKVDSLASPKSTASTPTPTSASNKRNKKPTTKQSKKHTPGKQEFTEEERRELLFKIYLELFRCIPFIVPEQLIKTVDPSHFIGSRLAYNDSLIATACSQALQRILCERSDLRAFVIEGCVMLLQSDLFDSNEASLITILDNITLMLEFWSDINRREITEMLCDINQTNEQIIGHLKASRWNERKAWIDKVETVAASCLCSSNFRLRRSALATLRSVSELIDSEKVDSLSGIEKHWKRRLTLHDMLMQHEPAIIQAAIYNLQMEDNYYCDDFSLDALKWSDEMATLRFSAISQREDCHLLWNLILVELVRTCQGESYTRFLVPLLELVRRRSERLLAGELGGDGAELTLREEQDRAMYWTNLMSVFFSGAGSDSPTDLQSIHSEVTAIVEGGVSRDIIWHYLSNNIHDWISTGLVKSVSKVHPDSAHLVIQSLNHWLESGDTVSQAPPPQVKQKKKGKGAEPASSSTHNSPSVFHMTDLSCRLCYNLSTHPKRLSEARVDSYQILLRILHRIRLTFASNGHEMFRAPNQLVKYLESELYFCNSLLYLGRTMYVAPDHRLHALMQPYAENVSLKWNNDELTHNVLFLQEISGTTPKARLQRLSSFMEQLLSSDDSAAAGGKKGKKQKGSTPAPPQSPRASGNDAARQAYREQFNTLAKKIQNTAQEAVSQLVKLNPLSLFTESTPVEDVLRHLYWFQGAEHRGYRVLTPLLSLHFSVLIEIYLEQIYSNPDSAVAVLYLRALHETVFPTATQQDHVPTTSTVEHAIRFIKTQHDVYHNVTERKGSNTEEGSNYEREVQAYRVKFLVLILWCSFHHHDEIHSHAYEMACDYVQCFHSGKADTLQEVFAQLRKYSSSFKTRSVTSLTQSAHSISRILSTVFLNDTTEVFEETFARFDSIFGPQGQLWCLKLLIPWSSGLLIVSQEIVDNIVSPLFGMNIPLFERFSFTNDMKDLWVNLAGAYERSTDATPNLAHTIQFLKSEAQVSMETPERLHVCREIIVCIFNAFPQITLDLLLVELKLTKYPHMGGETAAQEQPNTYHDVDENASVASHLSQLSRRTAGSRIAQQIPNAPRVPAITQLMNIRKAIILLITDIVCEAKHMEYIFQHLPVIFTFILCFFDDVRLRGSEFQKLLLNLLLRMGSSHESQEWNMLCRMLSQNETIQLNWNHKRQSFHSAVKKAFSGTEYESSCRKLLPVLEGEIYAVDLIKIFLESIKSSLSPKIVDAVGEHAMLCALNVIEPQELYRYLMIYYTSMTSFSQNHLKNVIQCLIKACEMAEVRMEDPSQYEMAAKCIQLCMRIIKRYTEHYHDTGILHTHELIFWTSVAMLSYPFNDIYAEALQIVELFSDDELCQQRFFNMFTIEEESSVPIADWLHPFTGLPILLINGFNRSQFEESTLKILLRIVQVSAHGSEIEGDFPLHMMENMLTVMLMLLVWMHREDIRNPTYTEQLALENACESLSALTKVALPQTKLHELIDYTILRRSKDLFFSNICSQICIHFFPLQSKQAVEELLCMLVSGQRRHQHAIVEVVKHLLRSASHETVQTFTPLITSCVQLTNSKVANATDLLSGLNARSSMLQLSIIDLMAVVSERTEQQSLDEYVDESFSLPSAQIHGLAADLSGLMKRLELEDVLTRGTEKESENGHVMDDDSLDVESFLGGAERVARGRRGNSTPRNAQQQRKVGLPTLARAAMAFNRVRKQATDVTPARHSPLPTVVDFRQNLERNMEEEQQQRVERSQQEQQQQQLQHQSQMELFKRYLQHKADYNRAARGESPTNRHLNAAEQILSIIEDDAQSEHTQHSSGDTLIVEPQAEDDDDEYEESLDEDQDDTETATDLEISVQDSAAQQMLSPIAQSSLLLKSFSSLEGLSLTMSPMRRAPEPPKRRAPLPRLRPAPKPFNKPRKVEEVLNDSVTFSYFKSFCLRSDLDASLLAFYEDVREFMNMTNLTSSRVKADAIVSKYLSVDSPHFVEELNGQTRTRILLAYNRNPQTPSKTLFSSAIEWILSIFDSYFDLFLESEEYVALQAQQQR